MKRSALTLIFSAAMVLGMGAAAGANGDCSASPLIDECVPETPSSNPDVGVLPQSPATPSGGGTTPTDVNAAAPTPTAVSPQPAQTLPVTGAETAALALGGLVLVSAGGALVWRSNRATA